MCKIVFILFLSCGTAFADGNTVKIEITATVLSTAGTDSGTAPVQIVNGIGSY